ncbi:MAG: hypothetical protein A2378_02165 [Candidatus Pacebacteria bacterium RIFOXYB1_FULL_44_10]|nr:MAG: hypothetical protein A2378_02165 [Candidatus Pacebacteria bacterium RIFOXYB1_FULL_44_10]
MWWGVGNVPFHFIRRFFYELAGVKLGSGSTIHMGARIYQPKNISIGEGSLVGEQILLDGRDSLTIGNHVDIASQVMIFNSEHDVRASDFRAIHAPVVIEDYVFIGPRAMIMPGVTIHTGAVVAGGAVVTKDVAKGTIVAGVPAKEIGERKLKEYSYRLGRPRLFQ